MSQCGWFNEGHRAENDIFALIYLLAHDLIDGRTVLADLIARSQKPNYCVDALDAPYEAKDPLTARSYRCSPISRFWSKEIPESERWNEQIWLKTEV